MSTRAHIACPTPDGRWAHVYCHYDGYPHHILPALEHYTPAQIVDAREVRQITETTIEAFNDPRRPEIFDEPTLVDGICHLYAWIDGVWKHVQAA